MLDHYPFNKNKKTRFQDFIRLKIESEVALSEIRDNSDGAHDVDLSSAEICVRYLHNSLIF